MVSDQNRAMVRLIHTTILHSAGIQDRVLTFGDAFGATCERACTEDRWRVYAAIAYE